jgi:hypothetical protein
MQKVPINQLSQPVREFLARVTVGQGILIEDEAVRTRYQVVKYIEASPEEQKKAWRGIQKAQQKIGKELTKQGVTEDDIIKAVLQDD